MTRRTLPLRLALALALASAVGLGAVTLAGCGTEDTQEAPEVCACSDGDCPEELCEVRFTLPAACDANASVTIGGRAARAASPGALYSSCSVTLDEGAAAEVAFSGVVSATGAATCRVGGTSVEPEVCTLRLALGDTCAGITGRESAEAYVDGALVGTITLEEPVVPCVVMSTGGSVEASIRSGTDLVLTNTISCRPPGGQLSMFMECQ